VAGGELISWRRREQSGDAYSLFENVTQPGYHGPPPHRHLNQDETFYVLEGTFAFQVEGETIETHIGNCVYVPRGAVHTFQNTGTAVGPLFVVVGPAGDFEAFVESTGPSAIRLLISLRRFDHVQQRFTSLEAGDVLQQHALLALAHLVQLRLGAKVDAAVVAIVAEAQGVPLPRHQSRSMPDSPATPRQKDMTRVRPPTPYTATWRPTITNPANLSFLIPR
jgi:mannose-6-phosphate isomerase-like protein (cupin superfamily)